MPNSIRTFTVDEGGLRLDAYLATQISELSRSQIQKLIILGQVTVNAEICKPRHILKETDALIVHIPDPKQGLTAEDHSLDILFEDDEILVINKPAGMVVHPQLAEEQGTLVHALLHYYPALRDVVYDPEQLLSTLRPGIVHRLDKDTSGVIIVAKTIPTLHALSEQFRNHTTHKTYTALVFGQVPEATTVHNWIVRKAARENMMGVSKMNGVGREAITHFTPEELFTNATLLGCRIETGRTHQIRVHCKYTGHPVLGDTLYANKSSEKLSEKLGITRQMLHATSLTILHPTSGKAMTFTAPLPSDMEAAIEVLRRKTASL
jgi:23S rRNA pseudouridine1911/1915/1917 synthase